MIKRNACYFSFSLLLAILMGASGCCRLAAQRLAKPIPVAMSEGTQQIPPVPDTDEVIIRGQQPTYGGYRISDLPTAGAARASDQSRQNPNPYRPPTANPIVLRPHNPIVLRPHKQVPPRCRTPATARVPPVRISRLIAHPGIEKISSTGRRPHNKLPLQHHRTTQVLPRGRFPSTGQHKEPGRPTHRRQIGHPSARTPQVPDWINLRMLQAHRQMCPRLNSHNTQEPKTPLLSFLVHLLSQLLIRRRSTWM